MAAYAHISNLYRPSAQDVLLFKKVYVLEKIHGSSANLSWTNSQLSFFPGGESLTRFTALFDEVKLREKFSTFQQDVTIYGEVYGGSCQKMSHTYGKDLRFIAFDVKVGDTWLAVPTAVNLVEDFGLEFVPWREIETSVEAIDALRDAPSEVAIRRGCGEKPREGVVIRPPIEVRKNNDERVIAKHKGEKFSERQTTPKVANGAALEVLVAAEAIATEWVTPMRLEHVLQKMPVGIGMEATRDVIAAMTEDVLREAQGEIVDTREARTAIGKRAVLLFKARLQENLHNDH